MPSDNTPKPKTTTWEKLFPSGASFAVYGGMPSRLRKFTTHEQALAQDAEHRIWMQSHFVQKITDYRQSACTIWVDAHGNGCIKLLNLNFKD